MSVKLPRRSMAMLSLPHGVFSQQPPRLVLASASPRRARLLTEAGYAFTVDPADVDEQSHPGETSSVLVERLARDKATRVARRHPRAVVLAADTVVAMEDDILGKPGDTADAADMLRRLSGRTHRVLTGWAVAHRRRLDSGVVVTEVAFRLLQPEELAAYIATGEPLDKAGAYAIQGGASGFVSSLRGPYDNVVGLPLDEIGPVLAGLGIHPAP